MDTGWAVFLTGLILCIPGGTFGIIWYNKAQYGYRNSTGLTWPILTISTIFLIVILWIIAVWMGVRHEY